MDEKYFLLSHERHSCGIFPWRRVINRRNLIFLFVLHSSRDETRNLLNQVVYCDSGEEIFFFATKAIFFHIANAPRAPFEIVSDSLMKMTKIAHIFSQRTFIENET